MSHVRPSVCLSVNLPPHILREGEREYAGDVHFFKEKKIEKEKT